MPQRCGITNRRVDRGGPKAELAREGRGHAPNTRMLIACSPRPCHHTLGPSPVTGATSTVGDPQRRSPRASVATTYKSLRSCASHIAPRNYAKIISPMRFKRDLDSDG